MSTPAAATIAPVQFPLHPGLILIDLDGTLVDSVPDLTHCVDAMLTQLGRASRGEAAVRNWVGNGVERLVKRALTDRMDGEPTAAELAEALPLFCDIYADNTARRSVPYPGVREGLTWLRERGYRLGCVTNKAARFTEPLLAALDLREHFELVISGDSLPEHKPHPLPLLHAADFFGCAPAAALMVGDSVSDVKAARAAGFAVVCVSYGYNHGEDIGLAGPDAVIDALTELQVLLN
ncbi:MAG: phosphoglycolate phosphatase [Chromatiaceae bacterium]|nr:MAG: phosphoglycolate phosphatase [Chromatiaceae bacterium]